MAVQKYVLELEQLNRYDRKWKRELIAAPYDPTATYVQGAYCTYDEETQNGGSFYKALVSIGVPEEWDASHWQRISIAEELGTGGGGGADTGIISDAYDPTSTYAVGDYAIYNNSLYRCVTAIDTPEEWTVAHWIETTVAAELLLRSDSIDDLTDDVGDIAEEIGDLSDLDTEDKSSLVAAINEAAQSGGSPFLIANDYDPTSTYGAGAYAIYNDALYRCLVSITTAEAWNASHWTETTVAEELGDVNGMIANQWNLTTPYDVGDYVIKDGVVYRCLTNMVAGIAWFAGYWRAVCLAQELTNTNNSIAPGYNNGLSYAVGDYVIYEGGLYRCTTAIPTHEDWNATHWTAVRVSGELKDIKTSFSALPATAAPLMDGTAAVGSSSKLAKEDHVHPSDTSRVPTTRKVNNKALSSDITLSAEDLQYDSTLVSHTAGSVGEALDEQSRRIDQVTNESKTVTGNPIEIADGVEGMPVKDLQIKFVCSRDLHGYSTPRPAGKNKMPVGVYYSDTVNGLAITSDNGVYSFQGTSTVQTVIIFELTHGFTIPSDSTDNFLLGNNTNLGPSSNGCIKFMNGDTEIDYYAFNEVERKVTSFPDIANQYCDRIKIELSAGTYDFVTKPMFCLKTESDDFEAGSNICPIVGVDSVDFTIQDAEQNPTNSIVKTFQFETTLYGGTIDVLHGKAIIDRQFYELNGTESWARFGSTQASRMFRWTGRPNVVGTDLRMCSHFPFVTITTTNTAIGYYVYNGGSSSSSGGWIQFRPGMGIYTVEDWKAYLAAQYANGTPVQVTYERASKITIDLTPEELSLFAGYNYIRSSNPESITMEYGKAVGSLNDKINRVIDRKASAINYTPNADAIITAAGTSFSRLGNIIFIMIEADISAVTADAGGLYQIATLDEEDAPESVYINTPCATTGARFVVRPQSAAANKRTIGVSLDSGYDPSTIGPVKGQIIYAK